MPSTSPVPASGLPVLKERPTVTEEAPEQLDPSSGAWSVAVVAEVAATVNRAHVVRQQQVVGSHAVSAATTYVPSHPNAPGSNAGDGATDAPARNGGFGAASRTAACEPRTCLVVGAVTAAGASVVVPAAVDTEQTKTSTPTVKKCRPNAAA